MKKNKTSLISKPLFFAPLVPAVLNEKTLSTTDRAILSVLIQLTKLQGHCFANNKFFAKNLNCSLSTVSKSINKMQKLGYITNNFPNPEDRGRGHHRTVRRDLIYTRANSINVVTPPNNTSLPNKKQKYNNKLRNNNNNNEFFPEDEKLLVSKKLDMLSKNKWHYYELVKSMYNEMQPLYWDSNTVSDLIDLCNKVNLTYRDYLLKVGAKNQSNAELELFKLFLENKPSFFKDSQPKTFLRFFNKVISQDTFSINIKHRLSTDTSKGSF